MLFKEFKKYLQFNEESIFYIRLCERYGDSEVEYNYNPNDICYDDLEVCSFEPILITNRSLDDNETIITSARLKVNLYSD